MRVCVGSENKVKIEAVRQTLRLYSMFAHGVEVFGVNIPSEVSDQPMSQEETIIGAQNRAKSAYHFEKGGNLAFGIESGLFVVPRTNTGYMDFCVCAIYTGTEFHMGISSGFECPPKVIKLVRSNNWDLNKAFQSVGLTEKYNLGNHEGAVGLLTKSRLNRLEFTKQAVMMAMIQIENHQLYKI